MTITRAPITTTCARPVGLLGSTPLALQSYTAPISNDQLTVEFKQPIAATDPLRTGDYAKTVVFTLSTTSP